MAEKSSLCLLKKVLTVKAAGQTLAEVERFLSGLGVREQEVLQLYIPAAKSVGIRYGLLTWGRFLG